MKDLKFIIIESLNGYHIINIKLIKYICPARGEKNKSAIHLIDDEDFLLSTEDQNSIYNKIKMELI